MIEYPVKSVAGPGNTVKNNLPVLLMWLEWAFLDSFKGYPPRGEWLLVSFVPTYYIYFDIPNNSLSSIAKNVSKAVFLLPRKKSR